VLCQDEKAMNAVDNMYLGRIDLLGDILCVKDRELLDGRVAVDAAAWQLHRAHCPVIFQPLTKIYIVLALHK